MLAQSSSPVKRYVEERGLPFFVLVDEERVVTKQYGVWNRLSYDAWNMAKPAVFLIEQSGKIRAIFVGETQAEFPSPDELLEEVGKQQGNPDHR